MAHFLWTSDKKLTQKIVKHHSNGTERLSQGVLALKAVSDDNPMLDEIRDHYFPLEKEGHNIMTRLAGAVALPGSQKTKELKEIGKKAAMFPMKADTWALLVEASSRAEGVGYQRQAIRDKHAQQPDAAIPHHPVKSIPMDLVHAMNARVAPPARPVCCLREGSCHCDGKKNVHTGTTVISSISEKEIQSTLADIATLQIHDSISPDMTETSAKMMQEESKLCSAVLA